MSTKQMKATFNLVILAALSAAGVVFFNMIKDLF
jgi:hypothetical protein